MQIFTTSYKIASMASIFSQIPKCRGRKTGPKAISPAPQAQEMAAPQAPQLGSPGSLMLPGGPQWGVVGGGGTPPTISLIESAAQLGASIPPTPDSIASTVQLGLTTSSSPSEPIHSSINEDPELISLTDTIRGNGYFRLNNSMVHLTYPSQFDEATYLKHIESLVGTLGRKVITYSIVKEFGKRRGETGEPYPHLHAAFKFDSPLLMTNARFFDYATDSRANSHCHIKAIKACVWDHICGTYHTKQGTPFTNYVAKTKKVTMEELQACGTEHDVVKMMSDKGDILKTGPALKAWEHCKPQSERILTSLDNPYPWQQFLLNILDHMGSDDRTITWVYNQEGSMGKSRFAEFLSDTRNACIITTPNVKDGLHAVTEHVKRKGYPPVVIFDMARSTKIDGIYTIIESLKSRKATSGKYRSASLDFPFHPLVLIFSNAYPRIEALTLDRWIIHVPDYNGHAFDYTFHGAHGQRVIRSYIEIETAKQNAAQEEGETYIPCIPFRERYDITSYYPVLPHMNCQERKKYWDRHVFPTFTTVLKHEGAPDVTIGEKPMTAEEIVSYEKWKVSNAAGEFEKDSARELELDQREAETKERVLEKFIKDMREDKLRRQITESISQVTASAASQ
jgi:hypothetical protein